MNRRRKWLISVVVMIALASVAIPFALIGSGERSGLSPVRTVSVFQAKNLGVVIIDFCGPTTCNPSGRATNAEIKAARTRAFRFGKIGAWQFSPFRWGDSLSFQTTRWRQLAAMLRREHLAGVWRIEQMSLK